MRPISLQNKKLETIISILGIILSAFIFAISVNTFISPTGMLTGGVSGISLIIGRLFYFKLPCTCTWLEKTK